MTKVEELAIRLTKASYYDHLGHPEAPEIIDRLHDELTSELAIIAAENGSMHEYDYDPEVEFDKAMEVAETVTNGKYTA